jgi:hypothetical protein
LFHEKDQLKTEEKRKIGSKSILPLRYLKRKEIGTSLSSLKEEFQLIRIDFVLFNIY